MRIFLVIIGAAGLIVASFFGLTAIVALQDHFTSVSHVVVRNIGDDAVENLVFDHAGRTHEIECLNPGASVEYRVRHGEGAVSMVYDYSDGTVEHLLSGYVTPGFSYSCEAQIDGGRVEGECEAV